MLGGLYGCEGIRAELKISIGKSGRAEKYMLKGAKSSGKKGTVRKRVYI